MTPQLYRRRDVLRSAAALGASLALPLEGFAAPAAPTPRRLYFEDPDYSAARISPDGRMIAFIAPVDGVRNLWLAPRDDIAATRPLTRVTDRSIGAFFQWAYTSRHIVFFQERDGDENWRAASVDIETGAILPLTPEQGVRSYVQEVSRHFPSEMLFSHNERDKRHFDIYRIDVVTGARRLLLENRNFAWVVTDSAFRPRLGVRYAADGSVDYLERSGKGGWSHFATVPIGDTDATQFIDFSDDGGTLYALDSRGRDKAALVAIDMASRRTTELAADPEREATGAVLDPRSRRPIAAAFYAERRRWRALDPATTTALDALGRHAPGDLDFLSRSDDGRWHTVYYERDAASGEFALYDAATGRVRSLFLARPKLAQVMLRPLAPVRFAARDGIGLNGYLTLPAAGARALPLVLLVHGGPYARDRWGYSPTHQWLAERGYAVLSVNYRGSTGYGKAFVTAADHEWGGKMHDDLVDAVDWAVAQGIADRRRVGFFGGSYGGYSALTALTKTPEIFACIVDLFGISNLITFMATIPPYWNPWFIVWKHRLGDPDTAEGRALLTERSPITHIAAARRPILIAQGLRDVRVVPAESAQMVQALKERNLPVTYVTFADEGHGFVRPQNRLAFNAVAEGFRRLEPEDRDRRQPGAGARLGSRRVKPIAARCELPLARRTFCIMLRPHRHRTV
jgi:dipeptidyl aminopeptidase/acylaminoacyl peptidase